MRCYLFLSNLRNLPLDWNNLPFFNLSQWFIHFFRESIVFGVMIWTIVTVHCWNLMLNFTIASLIYFHILFKTVRTKFPLVR
jgi:hypothetical protein